MSLDRPLAEYLPAEEIVKILGHPLDEKGFHREWLEKITARHILSHSSGFPHGETGKPVPLAFEPGTKWKYSANGYFYLQRVVEHLKGDTLDKLMQKEVLDPLGMTRSCMVWKPAYETAMASGHGLLGRPEAFRRRTEAHAGATLYTTAGDYARFAQMLLNGGELEGVRILGRKTVELMTTSHTREDLYPPMTGPGFGFGIGVGVYKGGGLPRLRSVGTFGWDGAAGTFFFDDPKEDLLLICFTQVFGHRGMPGNTYQEEFERLVYQALV